MAPELHASAGAGAAVRRVMITELMHFQFTTNAAGCIEVKESTQMPIFARVLNDCVGSLAPIGAPPRPSTHWIDAALNEFRAHLGESIGSAMARSVGSRTTPDGKPLPYRSL